MNFPPALTRQNSVAGDQNSPSRFESWQESKLPLPTYLALLAADQEVELYDVFTYDVMFTCCSTQNWVWVALTAFITCAQSQQHARKYLKAEFVHDKKATLSELLLLGKEGRKEGRLTMTCDSSSLLSQLPSHLPASYRWSGWCSSFE